MDIPNRIRVRSRFGALVAVLFAAAWMACGQSGSSVITVDHGPNAASQRSKPYVVLVSLDGFRYDYAEKYAATHLLSIAAHGASTPDGMIAGNRLDALPAPTSELETLLRFGMGPSGSLVSGKGLADDLVGAARTAVMATVSAADGGVHFTEVTMLAVAVSFTEVIEVTPDATGICA